MKSYINSFFLVATVFLFVMGCSADDVKELATTTVNIEVSKDIHVNVTENDPLTYNETITFDASSEASGLDVDNYEITGVTIEISNYSGQATKITNLSLGIEGTNLSLDMPIDFDTFNNAGPAEVAVSNDFLAALATEFAADNEITVNMTAELDGKPATFDMEITVIGKVKGSLL